MTDPAPAPAPEPGPEPEPETLAQRAADQWPLGLVLLGTLLGLAVVALGAPRAGCVVVAAALLFAAFLRALLPKDTAGMLAVRSRPVDLATMAVLGLALAVLAFLVPAR